MAGRGKSDGSVRGLILKSVTDDVLYRLGAGPGAMTVGRLDQNDISIDDSSISKRHAEILIDESSVLIRDLGSKNHTYVNGDIVTEHIVTPGDYIRFGTMIFVLQEDDAEGGDRSDEDEFSRKINFLKDSLACEPIQESSGDKLPDRSAPGNTVGSDGFIVNELHELERLHLRLSTILDISNILSSSLNIDEVLREITFQLRRVVSAEKIRIHLQTPEGLVRRTGSGGSPEDSASMTIIDRVAASGEVVLLDNACEQDELKDARSIMEGGIHSIMCVPIKSAGDLLGVIYMDNPAMSHSFSPKDVDLVEAVASQAAIAVKNALLLEEINEKHKKALEIERLAAIGTFAAEISHQMKNSLVPLQKLGRLKDLLPPGEEAVSLVESLTRSAERFEEINGSIRRLACPNKIDPVKVELSLLLDQALFNSRTRVNERGVRIIKEIDDSIIVNVDKVQFEQALTNLLVNAAEAFEIDGGDILLRATRSGENVDISVIDNGKGMDEGETERIFDLFYSTKMKKGGNGLGLPLVRAVVLAHGGHIAVKSEKGKGSEFTIRLPLSGEDAPE